MSANPNPVDLNIDDRFHRIEQSIADNQKQLAETRSALQTQSEQIAEVLKLLRQPAPIGIQPTPTASTDSPIPEQIASFVSRRAMLKNAALATLGAAAVFETMPSARAAGGSQGGDFVLGEDNSATAPTQVTTTASNTDAFRAIVSGGGSGSALYGSSGAGDGVHGISTSNNGVSGGSTSGFGVKGTSSSASGIYGSCTSTSSVLYLAGVIGNSTAGAGMIGYSDNGEGVFPGVMGISGSGFGVLGRSNTGSGLYGVGYGTASYGAIVSGGLAPLRLDASLLGDPNVSTSGQAHSTGELYVDSSGGLWYCVVAGAPGTWRQVAGSATAGSFVFLSAPTRFIDTRPTSASYTSNQASLTAGEIAAITFSGAGAVTPYIPPNTTGPTPVIPYGATGLTGRITVLSGESGPTKGGILRVSNILTDPLGFGSGLVQWKTTPENQIAPFALALNNTQVPGSGVIYFENSSSADTIDLIVDVTGYYY